MSASDRVYLLILCVACTAHLYVVASMVYAKCYTMIHEVFVCTTRSAVAGFFIFISLLLYFIFLNSNIGSFLRIVSIHVQCVSSIIRSFTMKIHITIQVSVYSL